MKDIEASWKNTLVLVFRSDFICVVFWLYLILTLPMGVAIWEPSLAFRAASSVQLVRCRHAPAAFAKDEKLLEQGQISIGTCMVWLKIVKPSWPKKDQFCGQRGVARFRSAAVWHVNHELMYRQSWGYYRLLRFDHRQKTFVNHPNRRWQNLFCECMRYCVIVLSHLYTFAVKRFRQTQERTIAGFWYSISIVSNMSILY